MPLSNISTSAAGGGNICFRQIELGAGDAPPLALSSTSVRQYLFVRSGSGHADLDGWHVPVGRGETLFVPCGTHAEVIFSGPARAFLFGLSEDFLISRVVPALGVSLANYWDDFHSPKKLSQWTAAGEDPDRERIWRELTYASRRIGSCSDAAVAAYVFLILFEKNNRVLLGHSAEPPGVKTASEQMPHAASAVLTRFRGLIEQHMSSPWSVSDYCQALDIRPADFAAACKAATGRTPGWLIQEQKLQRAMRELRTTDLSAAEIGYRLGFNDPAYFSRFFRRHTGRSPVEFRRAQDLPEPARGSLRSPAAEGFSPRRPA